MLEIAVPEVKEYFDERTNTFGHIKETTILLEHSLISIHKWEAKFHKPFLGKDKTASEILEYIKCMTIGKVEEEVYSFIPNDEIIKIVNYIKDPMSAYTIKDRRVGAAKTTNEIITAEIIYYWMIVLHIPIEFEKWHLQQLLTLIKVVNDKNAPRKKMSPREAEAWRSAENAKRRAMLNSKG